MKINPAILLRQLTEKLQSHYESDEANALARLLLREYASLDRAKLMINEDTDMEEKTHLLLMEAIEKLQAHEPVQHILGYAHFYGRDFLVNENVLIPRPETEELVDLIIRRHGKGLQTKILDIGTGSGCIPVTLKREIPLSSVTGLDISEKALAVAKANAEKMEAVVKFQRLDILRETPVGHYDLVISNPPYITHSEKSVMERNVLDYEPGLALFVPDDDPLLFYRRITEVCQIILKSGGHLYFEINEQFGEATAALLRESGFASVEIIKDLNGKDRIVTGEKV